MRASGTITLGQILVVIAAGITQAYPQTQVLGRMDEQACRIEYGHGVHKIEVDGRYFLLLVPKDVSHLTDIPIVVDVPGYSESPYYQMMLTGIQEHLQSRHWIGAIPFGTAEEPTTTCCPENATEQLCKSGVTLDKENPCSFNAGGCCGVANSRGTDDIEFVRVIVKYLQDKMCGSETNIFATGFSNGGMMTNRLGCQLGDIFKAIGPVGGNVRYGGDFRECAPSKSIGFFSFCGTRDSACAFDFNQKNRRWADINGCSKQEPSPTVKTESSECFEYHDCKIRTEYCSVFGLDHEWPGHPRPDGTSPPRPSTDIDATAYMFDRFAMLVE